MRECVCFCVIYIDVLLQRFWFLMEKANSDTAVNNVLELFKSRKSGRRKKQRKKKEGRKEERRNKRGKQYKQASCCVGACVEIPFVNNKSNKSALFVLKNWKSDAFISFFFMKCVIGEQLHYSFSSSSAFDDRTIRSLSPSVAANPAEILCRSPELGCQVHTLI